MQYKNDLAIAKLIVYTSKMSPDFAPRKDLKRERDQIARDFRSAVEKGLMPTAEKREYGFIPLFIDPRLRAAEDKGDIRYMRFRQSNPSAEGAVIGAQGLNFLPSHAVEILTTDPVFDNTVIQAMFGLREDGVIVRAYHPVTEFSISCVTRELDLVESRALVEYITDPERNAEKRSVAMRLTEDEERSTIEIMNEAAEAEKSTVLKVARIDQWHEDAQNSSGDKVIF